jgi:hypothetical protein
MYMKWFYRWLAKKLRTVWYDDEEVEPDYRYNTVGTSTRSQLPNSTGMSFTLYSATGGHVLEFIDCAKDDCTRLYLINDGDDFAKQVSHCVTIEGLRR